MASNRIPRSYDQVVALAADVIDGAKRLEKQVSLAQNTRAKIRNDYVDLVGDPEAQPPLPGKEALYAQAKADKTAAYSNKRIAESNARAYCATASVLKAHLGRQWNIQWQAAGFTSGSLEIPADPLAMFGELRNYFTAHPEHENPPPALYRPPNPNATAPWSSKFEARAMPRSPA